MLSGDSLARSYDNKSLTFGNAQYGSRLVADRVSFACLAEKPLKEQPYMFETNCTNGMRAQLHFQSCWDGKNLYKPDNSHVAYLSNIDDGICPPDHPVPFVHIFMETFTMLIVLTNLMGADSSGAPAILQVMDFMAIFSMDGE